ncbi:MAG: alpha-mannosidase, partial [Chloroflexota bacterium]|nr:alpha-mannosidase [Chloroflexota bacterium]
MHPMHHDIRMTSRKIAARLALITPLQHRRSYPLQPFRYAQLAGPMEPPPLDPNLDDSAWPTIPTGTYWGGQNINFVMRGQFSVPTDADRSRPLALYLPLGDGGDFSHPEALAYIDGEAYATTDRHHQEFLLAPQHCDGATHSLVLHGWTGLLDGAFGKSNKQLFMQQCAVIEIDTPTREFVAAARTALEAADLLDAISPVKTNLYNALDHAFMSLDTREPFGDAFYESVPAALEILCKGIAEAGEPLDLQIMAAGHAHIDVAWLWTLGQTRQKAGRSFYTVTRLMEQFPDYHFTQSQPQLYDYVRQDYPALFEAMKARVREGRWEPIGGMWVEADCNISGPESLARQFVIGRSFFREHFGEEAESPVLWLPDVFGYAWNLPQLIKLAGLEYFFTIKIGWNQVNKMPYDSFWWQGLDGTKVLTHFSTSPEVPGRGGKPDLMSSATYNANLSAFTALGSWAKLKHKESQSTMLMAYGYGDGGGGPTREMNENAGELQAFPGLPRVQQGKVIDFFRRLEKESADRLPTWNSALYLEIHRGTYTTQSRNKRANRKSEFLLHDAEFLAAYASTLDPDFTYPHETFRKAWELVCLNQFHDIIPGSSIADVYVESQAQYAEVRRLAEGARDAALEALARHVGGDVLLVNPAGFSRDDLALWQGELPDGKSFAGGVQTQRVQDGVLIAVGELEPN